MKKNTNAQNITKAVVVRASKAGVRKAAEGTMKVMGHNVVARNGWVVKVYQDGKIERLTKIPMASTNKVSSKILLDK